MACYLNQCWLLIDEAHWYLAEVSFTANIPDIIHHKMFEHYIYERKTTTLLYLKDNSLKIIDIDA